MSRQIDMFENEIDPLPTVTSGRDKMVLDRGTCYILDDVVENRDRPTRRFQTVAAHSQKCSFIRTMIDHVTVYDVQSVPRPDSAAALYDWFTDELGGKPDNDLSIIYYHGITGLNGEHYTFTINGGRLQINAYQLMQTIAETTANVLLLIDGYLPTRFWDKSGLKRDLLCRQGFEVLASGAPGQDIEGRQLNVNEFTGEVCDVMSDLSGQAVAGKLRRRSPFSINDLLKKSKLHNNPVRLWTSQTAPEYKKGSGGKQMLDKIVPRFKMDPYYIRANGGMIAFSRYIILDTKKRTRDQMEAENDEGYSETDDSILDSVIDPSSNTTSRLTSSRGPSRFDQSSFGNDVDSDASRHSSPLFVTEH